MRLRREPPPTPERVGIFFMADVDPNAALTASASGAGAGASLGPWGAVAGGALGAAGLNPILSAMKGGASTPAGATGNSVSPDVGTGVANSARMLLMELPRLQAEIENIRADSEKKAQEGMAASVSQSKMHQDILESKARTATTLALRAPEIASKAALTKLAERNAELSAASAKKVSAEIPSIELRSQYGTFGDLFGLLRKYLREGSGVAPQTSDDVTRSSGSVSDGGSNSAKDMSGRW